MITREQKLAIRAAREEFSPIYRIRLSELWTFDTRGHGARSAACKNYFHLQRFKNREVVYVACRKLGWTQTEAREFAHENDGRGTHPALLRKAIRWKHAKEKQEVKRRVA